MLSAPVVLLYLLVWLVVVPFALYLIIRTGVEHGIRRARREPDPRTVRRDGGSAL
jgi:hypothetical protein